MKKLIIASICVALGVALSTTSIPIGPARIFPFQHMINVILAVIVGACIGFIVLQILSRRHLLHKEEQ